MKRRLIALLLTLIFTSMWAPLIAFGSDFTPAEERVLEYLQDWSYVDQDTTFTLDVDKMPSEVLVEFFAADYDDLDLLIHEKISMAMDNFEDDEFIPTTIQPTASTYNSGWLNDSVTFTYGGKTYTRNFQYKISLTMTFSGGQIYVLHSSSCELSYDAYQLGWTSKKCLSESHNGTSAWATYQYTMTTEADDFTILSQNKTVSWTYYN